MSDFVKLRISGTGMSLDEITDTLSIYPKYAYKKGDTHYDKYTDKTITYQEDCWLISRSIEPESFEDDLRSFLLLFQDKSAFIKSLSESCEVMLWLSLYPESNHFNIHFSPEIIEMAHSLGVCMDVEVSDLREFYDGTYLQKIK
jgi:hypothetical protein